ncbi:MAG: GtrA family protein [Patescibacteria group bacterium]
MLIKQLIRQQWLNWPGQLFRFGLVGLSNAVVDFSIYLMLTRLLSFGRDWYLLMNVVAFLTANLNSFFWNQRWTFGHNDKWFNFNSYGRFLSLSLVYLLFLEIGLWWLVDKLGWLDLIAKAILLAVGTIFYFSANKMWVFKKSKFKNQKS